MEPNSLAHHGVKGMKWGVRKQPERSGGVRPGKTVRSKIQNARFGGDKVKQDRYLASKNRRNLSDQDLSRRVQRLQQEKKLKDLTEADLHPGRKQLKKVAGITLGAAATAAGAAAAKYIIGSAFDKTLPKAGNKAEMKDFAVGLGKHVGKTLKKVKK